jgi:hypothetical protein
MIIILALRVKEGLNIFLSHIKTNWTTFSAILFTTKHAEMFSAQEKVNTFHYIYVFMIFKKFQNQQFTLLTTIKF